MAIKLEYELAPPPVVVDAGGPPVFTVVSGATLVHVDVEADSARRLHRALVHRGWKFVRVVP